MVFSCFTFVQVKWSPHEEDWICLNIYDDVRKDGTTGCGGLLRNIQGMWIRGFSKHVGQSSSLTTELWGVLKGLVEQKCEEGCDSIG